MKTSRPQTDRPPAEASKERKAPADVQPPATGANRGSPAAPVMKQFQKTRSESTGRS